MAYEKPLPVMDPDGGPFWESCRRHEAKIQRCSDCRVFRFPPSAFCRECGSGRFEWTPVSGRGTVYSTVVLYRAPTKAWEQDVPLNCSLVELEEGARIWSNVVGCPPDDVSIGMPVQIVYDDVTDEVTLPRFRPVRG